MTDERFIQIVNESITMAEAARKVKEYYPTFKRFMTKAKKLKVYKPNQGAKGTHKKAVTYFGKEPCKLQDILNGKHPQYQSRKLKLRLIDEKILKDECNQCGWSQKRQNELYSTCELHHKNGDGSDHRLENLEILCPNCHSLTPTFRNLKRN